jgi:hypothetical protein
VFAEWDKQTINFYPIDARQNSCEDGRRLFWSRRVYISPAIRDAVHVDIDSDARLVTSNAEHEVGALRTNPVKGAEHGRFAGQNAIMFLDDAASDFVDLSRLRLMKGAGVNAFINGRDCRTTHFERSAGQGK